MVLKMLHDYDRMFITDLAIQCSNVDILVIYGNKNICFGTSAKFGSVDFEFHDVVRYNFVGVGFNIFAVNVMIQKVSKTTKQSQFQALVLRNLD